MPQTFKEKMYEYEAVPPQGVWESIAAALDDENNEQVEQVEQVEQEVQEVPPILSSEKRTGKLKYISMIAAAAVIIIVCLIIFVKPSRNTTIETVSTDSTSKPGSQTFKDKNNPSATNRPDAILQVPVEDDSLNKNKDEKLLAKNTPANETGPAEKTTDENNTSGDKTKESDSLKKVTNTPKQHTYITITGPDGQPVKICSKVAALMVSSDENSPPDPVWGKKIMEWKKAMQRNTLAATPDNFLDIVELTNTLRDN